MGTIAVLITVGMAIASVVGDYFLKVASGLPQPIKSVQFIAGASIYALTAFGGVIAMPHLKLAQIGVLFCITIVLCLCFMGIVFFKESLRPSEWVGVGLAILSLLLLKRIA